MMDVVSTYPSTAAVWELIAHHEPVDLGESNSLTRIRALTELQPDPFDRTNFEPGHLTASAVVVDAARERALLVFHEKLQRWLQPGGHFEPGEADPAIAAAREVLEETGLHTRPPRDRSPLLDVDVHLIPARKAEPAHRHFDLRFLLLAEEGTPRAGDGASAIRWIGADELEEPGLDPGLRRALRKALR